ncbi:MAG: alpha-amylase family glycosyl hydrolase [Planctomycetota bacterium]
MHRRMLTPVSALAALLALWFSGVAFGADVWRLAGTFNSWNTGDDAWAMQNDPPGSDNWTLTRMLDPGEYQFKFVRNGSWADAHFGVTEDGVTLAQPGTDITLNVQAPAVYQISMNTNSRRWGKRVAEVDEALIIARVLGTPRAGQPFTIDLSDSLIPSKDRGTIRYSIGFSPAAAADAGDVTDGKITVTPTRTGPLTADVQLIDGAGRTSAQQDLRFDVRSALRAHVVRGSWKSDIELMPQADGSAAAVLEVPDGDVSTTVAVFEGDAAEPSAIFEARAGTAGETLLGIVAPNDRPGDAFARFGSWVEASIEPPYAVEQVHLRGDFNAFAGPGQPGAIELASRNSGAFSVIAELPEGAYRYDFLLNGRRSINDPNAGRTSEDGRSVMIVGRTPSDFPPARPDNVTLEAVRHEPALPRDLTPISDGLGIAEVSISTLPGDVESVTLHLRSNRGEPRAKRIDIPMTRTRDLAGFDRWTARVKSGKPKLTYDFTLTDGDFSQTTTTFRADIQPTLDLPDWAKGAVWYQIFTERFRNGNPLNDPSGDGIYVMPWNADWYAVSSQEEAAWRKRFNVPPNEGFPERQGGDLFHVVFDRRYGGDLQGVVEKLDELQELGVTAIYFNPVFEGESMHKYDATDFRHIDDNFGTPASEGRVPARWTHKLDELDDPGSWSWTPADRYFLDVLLPEARERGIRIVIDGVWNHTGREFWAFQDVMKNGIESPYSDWFFAEYTEDGDLESWVAWDGPSGWLPKFLQKPNRDLVDPVKKHIFDVTTRWMDPNGDGDPSDGVDGWRLDVPLDVGLPFWEDWRTHVKSINPDAVIIAEIWQDAAPYLTGQHFDTHMHYPFAWAVTDWLGVRPEQTSSDLARRLTQAFDESAQTCLIHQNLFASHDTDRFVSMLQNPGRNYDQQNRPQDTGPNYIDVKPNKHTYQRSILGVAIQATYLGAPMIYYGDEYGMWGADDPTDRKPVPWPDTGTPENRDDAARPDIRREYVKWFNLRRHQDIGPVLSYGGVRHLESGNDDVFAYVRSLNGDEVYVVVNRGERPFNARQILPEDAKRTRVGPNAASYWFVSNRGEQITGW